MQFSFVYSCLLIVFIHNCAKVNCDIQTTNQELEFELNTKGVVNFTVSNFNKSGVYLYFTVLKEGIVEIFPSTILLSPLDNVYSLNVFAKGVGHCDIKTNSSDPTIDVKNVHFVVNVFKDAVIDILSQISGWSFFICWAFSYYPQIHTNFKRKSVVGFSFDYLALNIVGYVSFGIFTHSVYFSPAIQEEYFEKYNKGIIPVKANDVAYNLHGIFALSITMIQCFIYDRGDQRISTTAKIFLGVFGCFYIVLFILRAVGTILWLEFLYYCSYVKLVITMLKFIPQVYLNYKRKSTSGWSIGNVILNLGGGIFSIAQMTLDSYNYDDWLSIFGNPTKFGLGVFAVLFQVVLMIQHYILYREDSERNTKL